MLIPPGPYGIKKLYGEYIEHYLAKELDEKMVLLDSSEKIRELDKISGFLFSMDNYCSDMKDKEGKSIYQQVELPHVNYIWSEVVYLNHTLEELSSKQKIFVRDRHQSIHLKKYYNLDSKFLPIFGIEGKKIIPWEERNISVFFPASYLDEGSVLNQINTTLPEVMAEIANGAISILEKKMNFVIEDGIEEWLRNKGLVYTDDMIRSYMEDYGFFIESYLNRKNRNNILRTILAQEIAIVVCGVNWNIFKETLSEKDQNYINIIDENLSVQAVADYMCCSKIVLSLTPNLQDGIHERVATGIINGAICITDENPYMNEVVKDEDIVELFQWKTSSSIPKKIKRILQQEEKSVKKSKRAIEFGNKHYSVKKFWDKVID